MPYTVEYDPQGIITAKVQGQVTIAVVRNLTRDIYQLAKEKDCQRILTDLRKAELKLAMVEVYTLPKLFSEIAAENGLQIYKLKRAMLAPSGESLPDFFETVSRNRVHNIKVFTDELLARQWLFSV